MSSQVSSPHLSATPISGQRHRHRRSAAISGDFDALGLGLFSPPGTSGSIGNDSKNADDSDLDKHFHFNNQDDFTNKPQKGKFAFPNRTPDLSCPSSPCKFSSPPKRPTNYSLNSPIRLNHKKSVSTSHTPTKFFLTEETMVNSDNVPDAVIDLDRILYADQTAGKTGDQTNSFHKRTESAPADFLFGGEFLASPFMKSTPNPFSSPLSISNNKLFQQPIQEQTTEELDEDNTEDIEFLMSDNETETFTNPQDALSGLYSNSSANSSSSSLRSGNRVPSNHLIEKTFSNTSKDSSNSVNTISHSSNKRSGAKANRYQSFYDQSFKISNALKISSSESIDIIRSNSNGSNIKPMKEVRLLGHSSSLPSLKSNQKRASSMNPSRFGEFRPNHPELRKSSNHNFVLNDNSNLNNSYTSSLANSPMNAQFEHDSQVFATINEPVSTKTEISTSTFNTSAQSAKGHEVTSAKKPGVSNPHDIIPLTSSKFVTNSPISTNSDMSSTVLSLSGTIQSTDNSSFASHNDANKAKARSAKDTFTNFKEHQPPVIVVSNSDIQRDSNYSTNSGSLIGESSLHSNATQTYTNSNNRVAINSSAHTSNSTISVKSYKRNTEKPQRYASPSQEKVLNSTKIPAFKSPSKSQPATRESINRYTKQADPSTKAHRRSRSFSNAFTDLCTRATRLSQLDDTVSLNQSGRRRNSKIINWFKRR